MREGLECDITHETAKTPYICGSAPRVAENHFGGAESDGLDDLLEMPVFPLRCAGVGITARRVRGLATYNVRRPRARRPARFLRWQRRGKVAGSVSARERWEG